MAEAAEKIKGAEMRLLYILDIPEIQTAIRTELGESAGIHASANETSIMLYLRPDLVKPIPSSSILESPPYWLSADEARRRYPTGVWGGNPSVASPEVGETIVKKALSYISRVVNASI